MTKARRKDIKEAQKREAVRNNRRLNSNVDSLLQRRGGGMIRQKPRILIMCEGQNTEPSYFEYIHKKRQNVCVVDFKADGVGVSSMSLVRETIKRKNFSDGLSLLDKKHFDSVWVVFDRDENDDFKEAMELAENNGIKVAFSNQAFEYWMLLHFMDNFGAEMDRGRYAEELNRCMQGAIDAIMNSYKKQHKNLSGISKLKSGCVYDSKEKRVSEQMHDLMWMNDPYTEVAFYKEACKRALNICEKKKKDGTPYAESMTNVYELMLEIFGKEIFT